MKFDWCDSQWSLTKKSRRAVRHFAFFVWRKIYPVDEKLLNPCDDCDCGVNGLCLSIDFWRTATGMRDRLVLCDFIVHFSFGDSWSVFKFKISRHQNFNGVKCLIEF